jgi:DNA-binding MarR family transcriptional regulator
MSKRESISLEQVHHIRDSCLCLHVQRAARVVARRFDDALRPLGLTNNQFSLMVSLNVPGPVSMGKVAALLAVDRTTLTANLKPLERRGLLKVSVDKTDRRNRAITLTAKGRALVKSAYPVWEETHAAFETQLKAPDKLRSELLSLS